MTKNQTKLFEIMKDRLIGYVLKEEIETVASVIVSDFERAGLVILDTADIKKIIVPMIDKN